MITDFLYNIFAFNEKEPLIFTQFYFWAFFAVVMAMLCLVGKRLLLRNAFLFAVAAGVVSGIIAHYICAALDRHFAGNK